MMLMMAMIVMMIKMIMMMMKMMMMMIRLMMMNGMITMMMTIIEKNLYKKKRNQSDSILMRSASRMKNRQARLYIFHRKDL